MAQVRREKTTKVKKTATAKGPRILVAEARFYCEVSDLLLAGARAALEQAGSTFDLLTVPGALELPAAIAIACEQAVRAKRPYDGAVALGCVIQGETFHFDIVAMQSARGILDLSVAQRLPIGNGILTVDNLQQALKRARPEDGDKGGAAVAAALALVAIKQRKVERR
jgi:6,7-dimethyl-8-ribityllumazine synthase